MDAIQAKAVYIVEDVERDPFLRQKAQQMLASIHSDRVEVVDDAGLNQAVLEHNLHSLPRHGLEEGIQAVVILNRFRFEDPPEVEAARREQFPELFRNPTHKLSGYGGFEWRDSGSAEHRRKTGSVCQPAYQLHTIVGCPFRCSYCGLGRIHNIMLNVEEFVGRLDPYIDEAGGQTLYQYDNWTDTVCFEPEYGGSRAMIEYFAQKPLRFLELYVGKSGNVDFLLDLDHRGKTVCCWSVAGETQTTRFERRTANMEARLQSARRCQEAGYPVRFRLSPIIPVRNWREENRALIRRMFELTQPDVVTFETLRYMNYEAVCRDLDPGFLDPELLEAMRAVQGQPTPVGSEIPDDFRQEVYRFIIDELEAAGPNTPYAFCREQRSTWELYATDFARHGQTADRYLCNCGPVSAPAWRAAS
jgi:spore photoproduct lyase